MFFLCMVVARKLQYFLHYNVHCVVLISAFFFNCEWGLMKFVPFCGISTLQVVPFLKNKTFEYLFMSSFPWQFSKQICIVCKKNGLWYKKNIVTWSRTHIGIHFCLLVFFIYVFQSLAHDTSFFPSFLCYILICILELEFYIRGCKMFM